MLELARAHGIEAGRGPTAVRRAVDLAVDPDTVSSPAVDPDGFLTTLSERIAQSLIGSVAMIDPEIVVLAGEIGLAGGDDLADRVPTKLHAMSRIGRRSAR